MIDSKQTNMRISGRRVCLILAFVWVFVCARAGGAAIVNPNPALLNNDHGTQWFRVTSASV